MDLNEVEHIDFAALGGADKVTVNDLSGSDVTEVNIDLAAAGGGAGDGSPDEVIVNGTAGDDAILVAGDAAAVGVSGLAAQVNVLNGEAANDKLTISTGDGSDVVDGSGMAAGALGLALDGGAGDDVLIGGEGDDVLTGGDGDDILIGNGGNDILSGGAGDDILIGGDGQDVLDGGPGGNVILQDFQAGAGTEDRIDLSAVQGLTFDWLMEHATTVDGNTVLDTGTGQEITLLGVSAESLHSDDFILS